MSEWERRAEWNALQARYAAINRAQEASCLPTFVRQTPDWKSGWQAFHDWLEPHFVRKRCGGNTWRHGAVL